jgi:glycosyltransferase involved in cell wall biosynthesis
MIIVDDVSPDNSNEIIEKSIQQDSRIKLVKLEKNSGAAVARNRAIEEAKGRFIAFLDADDLWKQNKLEKQLEFMNKKSCALTYSYYDAIDEDNNKLEKMFEPPLKLSYTDLLKTNYIGCLSAMYDTQLIGKVYMPLIKKRQDYGLWLRILKQIDYAYCIPEVLATYRIRNESLSSNKMQLLSYNYRLFHEHEKFSSVKSFYYLFWNILIKITKS